LEIRIAGPVREFKKKESEVDKKPQKVDVGEDGVVARSVTGAVGNRSVVGGASDGQSDTILNQPMTESASTFLEGDDDTTYRSVPFRKAFTIQVKYQFGGRLKPLAYPDQE
jgi:hypothetical protein